MRSVPRSSAKAKDPLFARWDAAAALCEQIGLQATFEACDDDFECYLRVRTAVGVVTWDYRVRAWSEDTFETRHSTLSDALRLLLSRAVEEPWVKAALQALPKDENPTETARSAMEIEANAFAEELLMPPALLGAAVDLHGVQVEAVAGAFHVSEIAAQRRLRHLGWLR